MSITTQRVTDSFATNYTKSNCTIQAVRLSPSLPLDLYNLARLSRGNWDIQGAKVLFHLFM